MPSAPRFCHGVELTRRAARRWRAVSSSAPPGRFRGSRLSTGCAALGSRRAALHPWLRSVAPPGRASIECCAVASWRSIHLEHTRLASILRLDAFRLVRGPERTQAGSVHGHRILQPRDPRDRTPHRPSAVNVSTRSVDGHPFPKCPSVEVPEGEAANRSANRPELVSLTES